MVNMGVVQQFPSAPAPLDPFTVQTAVDQFQKLIIDREGRSGGKESWRAACCGAAGPNGRKPARRQPPSNASSTDNPLLKFLALNALELSAPASDVLLRSGVGDRSGAPGGGWFQLSGHPDAFAPAGPASVWKRVGPDSNEIQVYESLPPALRSLAPTYLGRVDYRGQTFIELQDLLQGFRDPIVMDIKLGTRTFLESEVQNTTARHDLYLKMVAVDPSAPTPSERKEEAVTKLRYMMFREEQSSTQGLGFRIEAVKVRGRGGPVTDGLKRLRGREEVAEALSGWLSGGLVEGAEGARTRLVARLTEARARLEASEYLAAHEVVGSSLLLVADESKAGAWLIDFAKTRPLPSGVRVDHRSPWTPGNHEEGLLFGLDNLIKMLEGLELPCSEEVKVVPSNTVALKS